MRKVIFQGIGGHHFNDRQYSKFNPESYQKTSSVSNCCRFMHCVEESNRDGAFNQKAVELTKESDCIFTMSFSYFYSGQNFSGHHPFIMGIQMMKEQEIATKLSQDTNGRNR